jgi:hypothetical protein
MKCSLKTMIWTAAVLFSAAAVAYLAFDGARPAIAAALPLLGFLLCPLAMLLMMSSMRSESGKQTERKSHTGVSDASVREESGHDEQPANQPAS